MMTVVPWKTLSAYHASRDIPSALSVGVFDGVHLGHRAIISGLTRQGDGLLPVIITFSRPPHNVLNPDSARKILLVPGRKLEIFRSLGVAVVVMIDFSKEFSKMTATSFFESLAGAFSIRKVVEGENFHFGRDRTAGQKSLAGLCDRLGASLETAETVLFKGLPVSSTRIRHAVQTGLMADVRTMLAASYPLDLPVGAAAVDSTGEFIVDKSRLEQAVPERGEFHCRTDTGAPADVIMDKERIFIRTKPPLIKTLYFEEK
jgi:riboflavin kinase/FMN adenylyltransferase